VPTSPVRTTVDLSAHPDLVVVYLGMRVEEPRGAQTLQALGPQIQASVEEQPDGLLLHEPLTFSEDPPHYGMRQYWRDFEALEAWSLELPHKRWWSDYLRDRGGTSFWHETYFRRGGFEAIYVDTKAPVGLACFAPAQRAQGPMLGARSRADADRASQSGSV
jgi:Domain of unknown function (DUF4188)